MVIRCMNSMKSYTKACIIYKLESSPKIDKIKDQCLESIEILN